MPFTLPEARQCCGEMGVEHRDCAGCHARPHRSARDVRMIGTRAQYDSSGIG